jgi:ribose-phosphate pyrophosphokinase
MAASRKLLFHIPTYDYMAAELAAAGGYDHGQVERRPFPDGERYLRLVEDPRGRDVVLLGGTPSDLDWLELYDLGYAVSRAGARTLAIVMPYFGYSTMERPSRPGEVVTAKTRARLISAIPPCEGGTQVFLLDLHTHGIQFYFSDSHVTHHLYGSALVRGIIDQIADGRRYVLGATDAGRAKWVESLAAKLLTEPAFVYKRRDPSTGVLAITGINADVTGRVVIIYDDMIRTGSSVLQAAQAYRAAGAAEVHTVASHLVLPGDSLARLLDSGLVASVNGLDSHPQSRLVRERGGRIASVAPLLAESLETL